MALLAAAIRPQASAAWSPLDDRWYTPDLGLASDAGVNVGPETIFRCAAVLAAVRFKAEAVAVCTPQGIRRMPGGRCEEAPDHYLPRLLRNPNAWQTGFEWTHLMVTWLSTWGNAYSRILPSTGTLFGSLWPLHPARMRVVDQASDGSLVYEYLPPKIGKPEILGQDDVLHYRALSTDGMTGAPVYALIRNAVGIALAAEKHAGTFLRKGTRISGVLSKEGALASATKSALSESWSAAFGGSENAGSVAVLGDGFKFQPIGTDHQKAQFVELREHQVETILMALGVPGVVVGYQGDKASTYASADAFFEKGGVKHCILPIVTNMEQREEKQLLVEGDPHQAKRNLDVLMRANTKDRFTALVQAAGGPFMTRNEVRAIEDMNALPDDGMDVVLEPGNMGPTGEPDPEPVAPVAPRRLPPPAPPAEDDDAQAREARLLRLEQLAVDRVASVVRREIAAIRGGKGVRGAAAKHAKDPNAWAAWVTTYYDAHAGFVAEALRLPRPVAETYAQGQAASLIAGGVAVVETWEDTVVPRLAALALGEE